MGCDIHLSAEVKIDGKWHTYSIPNVPRSYALFNLMNNSVRHSGFWDHGVGFSPRPSLPSDLAVVTRLMLKGQDGQGHGYSWLCRNEIKSMYEAWIKRARSEGWDLFESDLDHQYFGYLERNSWAGDLPGGVQDIRFVFCFDN